MKKRVFGPPQLPPLSDGDSGDEFQPAFARTNKNSSTNHWGLLVEDASESDDNSRSDSSTKTAHQKLAEVDCSEPGPSTNCVKTKKKNKDKTNIGAAVTSEPGPSSSNGSQTKKMSKKKKKKTIVMDEVTRSLMEVNALLGTPAPVPSPESEDDDLVPSFLTIKKKYLSIAHEVQTKFSCNLRKDDNPDRRKRGHWTRQTTITYPKQDWPPVRQSDLHMQLIRTEDGISYFKFEHGTAYNRDEALLKAVVISNDLEFLGEILLQRPYHVNTLLQLATSMGIAREYSKSQEFLERAIHGMEHVFHQQFKLDTGTCRLEYQHYENRGFHIAILKYARCLYNMACHRTALELCKLLLMLDPSDPLAVILVIDTVALRGKQLAWLVELVDKWSEQKQLLRLPNMAFSYALAKFIMASEAGADTTEAGQLLQEAILKFPWQVLLILDCCNLSHIKERYSAMEFFSTAGEKRATRVLWQMTRLYAMRSWSVWKQPRNMEWLTSTADILAENYAQLRIMVSHGTTLANRRIFQSAPVCVLRHLSVLDNSKVQVSSFDSRQTRYSAFNPYPPEDLELGEIEEQGPHPDHNVRGNPLLRLLTSLLPWNTPGETDPMAALGANLRPYLARQGED